MVDSILCASKIPLQALLHRVLNILQSDTFYRAAKSAQGHVPAGSQLVRQTLCSIHS